MVECTTTEDRTTVFCIVDRNDKNYKNYCFTPNGLTVHIKKCHPTTTRIWQIAYETYKYTTKCIQYDKKHLYKCTDIE